MTAESLVKSLVEQMSANGFSYSFHSVSGDEQEIVSADVELPVVFLGRPMKYKPQILISGHFRKIYICTALIVFQDSFGNTEEQKNQILDYSHDAQRELHLLLDNSPFVKNLTVEVCPEVKNFTSAVLSGIMMNFSFEMKNTDSVCL